MRLAKEIARDIKAARKIRLPWWLILGIVIISMPIYGLFDYFGDLAIALPLVNVAIVLSFAVAVKWSLRRMPWFWGVVTVIAALHAAVTLSIQWTTSWVPALAIAGVDSLDLVAIIAVVDVVGRAFERPARGRAVNVK
jgi:hypothetical protein